MPNFYIISGCNGSGKTTASYTLLPDVLNCREFVNSDEFAKSLSPFDPSAASVTASKYMLMRIHYLIGRFETFCVETTLATRALLKIIADAQAVGYEVTIIYFWVNSPEVAIKRVHDRVATGGHNIPDHVVRRRYVMGLEYFFNHYSKVCDNWILADNSNPPYKVVAEGNRQLTKILDNEKYLNIRRIIYPEEK